MQKKGENKMGTQPIGRLLFSMSLPMMISMLAQALYNVVDSMYVSRVSEEALTALSMAFPLQNLMIAVASGLGVGINAVLSRALGARDNAQVHRAATNGIFLLIVCALAFTGLGCVIVRPYFSLQTDIPAIVEGGTAYTSIVMIGCFGLFMQVLFERLLQSTGRTMFSMASQATGAVLNIVLDPIMIFGYFGLPAMGFSPDANFPLINTEKGITAMELVAPVTDARLLELVSGTRCNVVPGRASALVAGDLRAEAAEVFRPLSDECEIETSLEGGNTRIVVTGVPAHASTPEKGYNAAKMLLAVLHELEIGGAPVDLLVEASGEGDRGVNLGISGKDAVSGELTINLGLLSLKGGSLSVTYDCRYPVMFDGETVRRTVAKRLAPAGYVLQGICGVEEKPYAIGGGTYARHLEEGVAFGMLFPGELELEHQANESIDIENFKRAARIYAYAILAMCG